MASVTSTLTTNLTFIRQQSASNRTQNDQAETKITASLAAGTGVSQNDFGHQESGLLTASQSKRINFSALQQNILGATQTVDLNGASLKSILIINNSSNGVFSVFATGSLGFLEPFGGQTGVFKVPPSSHFSYFDASGIAISNGHSLWINDQGSSSSFILGLTAATG